MVASTLISSKNIRSRLRGGNCAARRGTGNMCIAPPAPGDQRAGMYARHSWSTAPPAPPLRPPAPGMAWHGNKGQASVALSPDQPSEGGNSTRWAAVCWAWPRTLGLAPSSRPGCARCKPGIDTKQWLARRSPSNRRVDLLWWGRENLVILTPKLSPENSLAAPPSAPRPAPPTGGCPCPGMSSRWRLPASAPP